MATTPNARVAAARQSLDEATRTTRLAAIAARGAFARRARRRRRAVLIGIVVLAVLALVTAVVLVVLPLKTASLDDAATRDAQVLAAASSAITTMLTADPKHAASYADSVIAMSTGTQRATLAAGRAELVDEISRQQQASTGVVLDAGLVTDPSDAADATADVLVVAEATNPALIGGDPSSKRMPIVVTMALVDGTWKVAKAGLQQ